MREEIAQRIKKARNDAELSVLDVHKKLNVTRQTVYNWEETGEIREDALESFCKLTKTEPAFIRYGIIKSDQEMSAGNDWENIEKAYVFAKQVAIQYEIESPAFDFIVMKWKYKQIEKEEQLNEVEKMAAFSKFMNALELYKKDKNSDSLKEFVGIDSLELKF